MARKKPGIASSADVIVKTFRAAEGKPVTVRLINPTPEIVTIEADERFAIEGETFTIDAPKVKGDATTFDFAVSLNASAAAKLARHVKPMIVELVSGRKKYRETIMPAVRSQRLRYHFLYGEPMPDLIPCPRHGLVRANRLGQCPENPPHTV